MTRSRVAGESTALSHGPRAEALERRLLFAAGELDLHFSGDGRTTIDFGFNDVARDVVVDDAGRVIAAGYDMGGPADFAVARFRPDGELDTTFNDLATPTPANGDGKLSFGFEDPSSDRANAESFETARLMNNVKSMTVRVWQVPSGWISPFASDGSGALQAGQTPPGVEVTLLRGDGKAFRRVFLVGA